MEWVKALGRLLIAVGLFLSFRYLAEFSTKQSIALTLSTGVAWGLSAYLFFTRHVQPPFRPFYVVVLPNWYELLRDHKLIGDDHDWEATKTKIEAASTQEYHVIRDGVRFTVLKAQADSFGPTLVYWNNRRNFLTEVDLCEPIGPTGDPAFYIKSGVGGYHLGLEVMNIVLGGIEPTKRLHVATIPHEEVCVYWYKPELLVKHWEKFKERRDHLLAENGWKRKDFGTLPINRIEHKYFTVWHASI